MTWQSSSPGAAPIRIMGVLNVTPDSFSDGGRFLDPAVAIGQARHLVSQGADLLDIGAESTRPGFTPVTGEEELRRLLPVLDALEGELAVPVSIDTTKAVVAKAALARGASIVNDVWGFQGDPAMPGVVADHGAQAVLMHNRHERDASLDIVDDMRRFFARSLGIARAAGIPETRLILDPGIGFGKTPAQQTAALAGVDVLVREFGCPILVGVSRKSFLGPLMGETHDNRLVGTIAANLAARAAGATLFRVHDVAEHVAAFRVFGAIRSHTR